VQSLMAGNTTQDLLKRGFLLQSYTNTHCNISLEDESCVLVVGTYMGVPCLADRVLVFFLEKKAPPERD